MAHSIPYPLCLGLLSLTPGPPPFSSMKAMPAASIASLIRSPVLARPPIGPSVASSRLIVGTETPEKFAASS